MPITYEGILRNNHIEWSGKAPEQLPADRGVRVRVTLMEDAPAAGDQGQRMAMALSRLAVSNAMRNLGDPGAWEREIREDRPLPGREV